MGYMMVAALVYSLIPLVVALSGGAQVPFVFNAWLSLGVAVGCVLFLLVSFRGVRADFVVIRDRLVRWPACGFLLLACGGSLDYALFAWSLRFIDIMVAVILFEVSPVGTILCASWAFRGGGRYRRLGGFLLFLLSLCVAGVVFANLSQVPGLEAVGVRFLWNSALGAGLVMGAVFAVALSVFGVRWGVDLSRALSVGRPAVSVELACGVMALLVVSLVSVPVSAGIGLAAGETLFPSGFLMALAGGVFANALASIAWRKSVLSTDNLGVNAIGFGAPVLSLLWLYWFAHTDVVRWHYLLLGAGAILSSNLLITFEDQLRDKLQVYRGLRWLQAR